MFKLYYTIKTALKLHALRAEEASLEAAWQQYKPEHATRGDRVIFNSRMGS